MKSFVLICQFLSVCGTIWALIILFWEGSVLGSILIIKNNYELQPEVLERLEKVYKVYVVEDTWGGLDTIDEHHIDIFAIMLDDYIEASTQDFLKELNKSRSRFTPVIFIAKVSNEQLKSVCYKRSSRYLTSHPIHHEELMLIIKDAMEIAVLLDDKSIVLEKVGHQCHYKVRDISRIERSRNRTIKVYSRNPDSQMDESEEFHFDAPLAEFPKQHGIEKYLEKPHQSWLVNKSHVRSVRTADMEIDLAHGIAVPANKAYIKKFKKKEKD